MIRFWSILGLILGSILSACGGGIPGASDVVGSTGSGIFGSDSSGGNSLNPATRPTPGFTEVAVNPATSVTEGNNLKFSKVYPIKFLSLNLGGIEIDEVRMVIENLNFDDQVSPGVEGPGVAILRLVQNGVIVDQALPNLGAAILPEGIYQTLDFNYRVLSVSEIPPEAQNDPVVTQNLVNHSIVVEGSYLFNLPLLGTLLRIPFRFLSDQTSTVRIEDINGLAFFGQEVTHNLFLVDKIQLWFDLTVVQLLQSLSITVLPVLGGVVNGILEIDANSAVAAIANIAITIEQNINTAFRFGIGPDATFTESDVIEASFSFVLLP